MQITRHFVAVGPAGRRVHYRRCGEGPMLLLVPQSPRSSAEYEPLMREWGRQFTCIAPDTPGIGLSDPWQGEPPLVWSAWGRVLDALASAGVAVRLDPLPPRDPERLYHDLSPDRFGAYLGKAWSIARASALFEPWYAAGAATAAPVRYDRLQPAALARDVLHRLRSAAARALHVARLAPETPQGEA